MDLPTPARDTRRAQGQHPVGNESCLHGLFEMISVYLERLFFVLSSNKIFHNQQLFLKLHRN